MSRSLVVDASGLIVAVISGDPRMFAAQSAQPGQQVFAIINDDGARINDRIWLVDDIGSLAMKPYATGDAPPPYELFPIAV
jgi:hypothetical protein